MIAFHDSRVVLVTGAGGGIGKAIVRGLVASGARVVAHDVRSEPVEALALELGERVRVVTANLVDAHETEAMWDEALAQFGRIDVLVNNAGIYPAAPIDQDLDDWMAVWDRSLAVNLKAPGTSAARR